MRVVEMLERTVPRKNRLLVWYDNIVGDNSELEMKRVYNFIGSLWGEEQVNRIKASMDSLHGPPNPAHASEAGAEYPAGYTQPEPLTDESRQFNCKVVTDTQSYSLET